MLAATLTVAPEPTATKAPAMMESKVAVERSQAAAVAPVKVENRVAVPRRTRYAHPRDASQPGARVRDAKRRARGKKFSAASGQRRRQRHVGAP